MITERLSAAYRVSADPWARDDLPQADALVGNAPGMPRLLSSKQVAALFGRSERTIRNWIRNQHLRPVRIGRAVFFHAKDIDALLNFAKPPLT